ncbi:MAG: peptidoglycan-binding protein [Candidatus Staskawiczbacteria bacterium]|nr:peptidoglycan-binding protein [Candidatus Staskawiczbacteria bacterium]
MNKRNFIFIGLFVFLSVFLGAGNAKAVSVGDIVNFNVDSGFDVSGRTQISSTLVKTGARLYFYVDKLWWDSQAQAKQSEILVDLDNLSNEFDNNIYPKLTSTFGLEWSPGIDNDSKITILFQPMNSTEGGYFREADGYIKIQMPTSNEREMVYLSTLNIESSNLKTVLGHEFTHLITFNQKNKIFGVEEDTWLNEARADYSSTILGYDDKYEGSNLQQRIKDFVENPSDSITDWSGTKYDYASINLFTQYLVEHYGLNILSDSLKSKLIGIESINQVFLRSGFGKNFAQVFTDWTITLAVNNCTENSGYCYSNQNLNSLRVNPTLIFLPLAGSSSLSATNITKNWAGNWQKIIGGSGNLKLEFSSLVGLNFQVPYILYDKDNSYSVKFLQLDNNKKGEINIQNFGTNYKSLIIIPSLQTKTSGFDGLDLIYPYSFTVSITGNGTDPNQALIQQLLAQIESLRKQIADILAQRGVPNPQSCSQISSDLYFGMQNNSEVSCLQGFLKNQGADIYPEGLVTGNFGNLTKSAVIKFQTKYNIIQTGFVGPLTRTQINKILNGG